MKKRLFSILLILCMVLSFMPITVFAETRPCPKCQNGQITATYQYRDSSEHFVHGSCAICEYSFVLSNKHIWDGGVIMTPSTCTTTGMMLYTCTECGGTKREEIPAKHNLESGWSKDSGKHWKNCLDCNEKGNSGEHIWNDYVIDVPATCTGEGRKRHVCKICKHYEGSFIPATGHSFGDWETVTSPTCTDKGSEKHTCTVCQAVETIDINPNGHSWERDYTIDKEAGCESDGSKSIHCSKCDALKDSETITATGHDYKSSVTTAATCTTEGVRTYVCKNDSSHTYTEPIPVNGHDLVHHEAQTATCIAIGWDAYDTCNNCAYTTYTEIPATGHSWENDYTIEKEATCESDGRKSIHCSKCDAVKDSETITATGHDYESSVTTAATCTTEGVRTYVCKNDSSHTYTEPIPSNGHALVHHEAQPATCIAIGWNAYDTCNNCDYTTYTEIPATGHSFGDWETVTSPTCTDKGSEKRTCTVCQAVETRDVDPNGHDLVHHDAKAATKVANGNIEYWYCEGCGKYFSDKDGTKKIKKADTVTAKMKDDSKSPQTGDTSNLVLWITLLFVSGGAAIGTTVVSRKKKYNR